MIKFLKRWQELKQLEHAIREQELVLQNPMNECPEDFRKHFADGNLKRVDNLIALGATNDQINKAIANGLQRADAVSARIWML